MYFHYYQGSLRTNLKSYFVFLVPLILLSRPLFYNYYDTQQVFFTQIQASLDSAEIKTIAAYLELKESEEKFEKSMQEIIDIYQKNGAFIKRLCQTLYQVYSESNNIIILYSYLIDDYKVLI